MKIGSRLLLAMAMLLILAMGAMAQPVSTTKLYTSGDGDGSAGRDWYSRPNYYWTTLDGPTVDSSHDGGSRWSNRGAVIIDISSLAGQTFEPGSVTFNFYSFGYTGTQLQHIDGDPGAVVTTGFAQAGGSYIADLDATEGWKSYDVTSFIQSDVNNGYGHVGFIFPTVVNYCGGSIAASEDSQGRGAYLEYSHPAPVPEPGSLVSLAVGLPGLAAMFFKKRAA